MSQTTEQERTAYRGGLGRAVTLCGALVSIFFVTGAAFAQAGPTSTGSQGAQATQLPLSGRTSQTGSVEATEAPVPGTTTSINTLNPTIQVSGPYADSTSGAATPFSGKLSLQEAVRRGLDYNLGRVDTSQAMRQAHSQTTVAKSALLPNLSGDIAETVETVNLAALGIRFNFPIPGFTFPTLVGPFNTLDVRARLSQTVADLTALNNYRSSKESLRADQLSVQDARELVALAVTGAYLEVIAAQARVESGRTQLDTANALYGQTTEQFNFGKVPQIDVNRSRVEMLTEQQRLTTLQNDLAKQKLNLARLTGLPVTDQYELTDTLPYAPGPAIALEDALKQALDHRADLKAAEAQVRAAELARTAAHDEYLPSLAVNADAGVIGQNPAQARPTYTVTGTLTVPIWRGGRTSGDVESAEAALAQRRAELEDTKGQIESQVREAFLDLQAAAAQVEVAQQNLEVNQQTLGQTRQKLEFGVSNNIDQVQSQQSVSSAELDYINSVFAHNVAKVSLARALGQAADNLPQFLKMQ